MAESNIEMPQELAQHLMFEGSTLILLNVPEGTEFGIDMKSWNTGENFRGVKMIPPGLHYVFYNCVSETTGDTAPRVGFLYNFQPKEIVVKEWDEKNENFVEMSDEEVVRIRNNLLNLDRYLGPYPYDTWSSWIELTDHLRPELASRLVPSSEFIYSALELRSSPSKETHTGTQSRRHILRTSWGSLEDDSLLPTLVPAPGTATRLTAIPPRCPADAEPAEVTKYCMDSSYALNTLIASYERPMDILGELQFSFVIFLIGHSLEGFEHWKKLIKILCTSHLALKRHSLMYDHFIKVLQLQIHQIPNEFLVDIVEGNSFVYLMCRELFKNVYNSGEHHLRKKVDKLIVDFSERFQWSFDELLEEDEDELPVIVNLD